MFKKIIAIAAVAVAAAVLASGFAGACIQKKYGNS